MNSYIIKSGDNHETERYDPSKLHDSLTAACLSVRTLEGEAETVAQRVCDKISNWLEGKIEVTSDDLRRSATKILHTYQPEAAYIYESYKNIL